MLIESRISHDKAGVYNHKGTMLNRANRAISLFKGLNALLLNMDMLGKYNNKNNLIFY